MGETRMANDEQFLDGKELEYTYSDGGKVVLSFYGGLLKYRWVAGPFEGRIEENLAYRSREIRDGQYAICWHDKQNSNFATLIIDLSRNALQGSAILDYGGENELIMFDVATIERAT